MISFIIPAHQEEHLISLTIHSIKNNSWREVPEIIVVENGSTDRTAFIAQEAGATVYSLKEKSRSLARNFGASQARGDWLIFLDADVILNPQWSAGFYKATENSWYEVIQGPVIPAGKESYLNRFRDEYSRNKTSNSYCSFISKRFVPILNSACFGIKKKKFDSMGGFDIHLQRCEDVDLGFRLFFDGAIFAMEPQMKSEVYWSKGFWRYLWRFFEQGESLTLLEKKWNIDFLREGRGSLKFNPFTKKYGFLKMIISVLKWVGWKKGSFLLPTMINSDFHFFLKERQRNAELPLFWGLSGRWRPMPKTRFLFGLNFLCIFYVDQSGLQSWHSSLENLERDLDESDSFKGFSFSCKS